ncbi:MAG: aa3-type cytochrome c oxidase subunit IV [Parvibaculum sp.]
MAENKATPDWGAAMRADEHIGTYAGFLTVAKWGIGALVVIFVLMAIFLL